uniref:Uncharacterized protein n=1 Tax=Myoviridae sp. ct2DO6 TaxID=2825020 RepID=A0A8S5Q2K4_9CAUD|nr:MAG TPA: hypothetical protein [Myoviridae sp. ct2DO6]
MRWHFKISESILTSEIKYIIITSSHKSMFSHTLICFSIFKTERRKTYGL